MLMITTLVSEKTMFENRENRIKSDLILFSIPLFIYLSLNYLTLALFHVDSVSCLIGYQLVSLLSVYFLAKMVGIKLIELYFNDKYKSFGENTAIFISIALLMFGTSRIFIATPPLFAAGIIGAPVLEELIFRGFLYNLLKKIIKFLPLVFLVDSILFSIAHYCYTSDTQVSLVIFLIGLFSCYLRERYNSLIPCTYLHFLNNLGVFLR